MSRNFPLFASHLDLAYHYWELLLKEDDTVIDATCGNGKDALRIAKLVSKGLLIGIDLQKEALAKTEAMLQENLSSKEREKILLFCMSHEEFPPIAYERAVKLIVYNLGYLPGGDKSITTLTSSTLKSLEKALSLVSKGGAISITCYPGHEEGSLELKEVLSFASSLDPKTWSICHHQWINRKDAPTLLFLQKSL